MRNALILCLLVPLSGFAQSTSTDFATALQAHGGSAVSAVQTVVITGQSTVGTVTEPIVISASLDSRVRLDYGRPVRRSLVRTPGSNFDLAGGKREWKTAHTGAFAQLDWLSVLGIRHLAGAGIERTALGPGSVSGRAAVQVRAVTGREQTHYRRTVRDEVDVAFDAGTGLVAAITRRQFASESLDLAFRLTTVFSDYRPVAGLLLPFRIERYLDGQLRETVLVEGIQLNPALPADLFER